MALQWRCLCVALVMLAASCSGRSNPSPSTAGSSSSSSGSTPSSSHGTASRVSSSSSRGGLTTGVGCSRDEDCRQGLTCVATQCLQTCTQAGVQDVCPAGQRCQGPFQVGVNLCLEVHGVGETCSEALCDTGLACNTGALDDLHREDPSTQACVQACEPAATSSGGCPNAEQCLRSSAEPLRQWQDAGVVACDVDGGAGACDQAHGFTCVPLPEGSVCAKDYSACGTSVPLHPDVVGLMRNLLDLAVQIEFISSAYAANFGPDFEADTGQPILAGRRFCDGYPGLPNAALVKFHQLFSDAAIGVCVGLCNDPPIPAHVPGITGDIPAPGALRACPTGFHCSTAEETVERAVVGGATPVACQVDGDCRAYAGSVCWTDASWPAAPKVCAYRLPVCVGDVGSAGSSSSG